MQRRPVLCGSAALVVLVILAIPLFSMRLAFTDSGNDPTNLTTRQAYDLISDGFGPGFNGPLVMVAELPGGGKDRAVVTAFDHRLATVPGVARVQAPTYNRGRERGGADRLSDHRPTGGAHGVVGQPPARRGGPPSHCRHRREDPCWRGDRGRDRRVVVPVSATAVGDRPRDPGLVPAAHGGVPLRRHPAKGRRDEPVVDRGRLRGHRRRLPVGVAVAGLRWEPAPGRSTRGSR